MGVGIQCSSAGTSHSWRSPSHAEGSKGSEVSVSVLSFEVRGSEVRVLLCEGV